MSLSALQAGQLAQLAMLLLEGILVPPTVTGTGSVDACGSSGPCSPVPGASFPSARLPSPVTQAHRTDMGVHAESGDRGTWRVNTEKHRRAYEEDSGRLTICVAPPPSR